MVLLSRFDQWFLSHVNTLSAAQESTVNSGLIVPSASISHFPTLETQQSSNALFLISIAPSLLACCVILTRALQHLPYRPQWLLPFVQEQKNHHDGGPVKRHYSFLLITFFVLSCLGLIAQSLAVVFPVQKLSPLTRALTWVSRGQGSLP